MQTGGRGVIGEGELAGDVRLILGVGVLIAEIIGVGVGLIEGDGVVPLLLNVFVY